MSSLIARVLFTQREVLNKTLGSGLLRQSFMRRGNFGRGGDHGYPEPGAVCISI